MSCRRLLSLLCLSVVPLLLVSLTLANGALTVDEDNITVRFDRDSTAIVLPINNGSSVTPCILRLELLNPDDHIITSAEQRITIQRGKQRVSSNLAFSPSSLKAQARRSLLWFRLHYQVINCADKSLTDGIVSLSQITRDLFDIRVGMPLLAREDMRYRVRVQAVHPVTLKPANNVNLDGILTLETDVNDLQLHASGITDSKGYAVLTFDLPSRFPTFPHELRAAGGSIKITGRRAGLVAEAEHDVLVDQFARIILSTDKPLYQPGQVLHLRALAFSPTRHALTNQKAIFKITDSEETLIFRGIATTSRFGIASIDWSIPENIRLGEYDVQVAFGESEDSSKTSTRVRVSRYDLPNFKVITRADRAYYIPGQKAEVKVTAQYLFGQPVTRGHVRVVRETERKWNYEKQKWDIEEGQSYEGETDNNGSFSAQIDLSHEAADLIDEDSRFKDVTYAAYFTEPTANRTEQHRFDLRVTKEPIHVYLIDTENLHNAAFPLRFFVSTFYANGEPAPCQVIVNATDQDKESFKVTRRIRTNRFGLARVSFPAFGKRERDGDIAIKLSASDRKRNRGTKTEEYWLEKDSDGVQIATDKSLYRPGDPIQISINSNVHKLSTVLEIIRNDVVLETRQVRLYDGYATLTIPYQPQFQDKLFVVAYKDFADSQRMISSRSILFPRDRELRIQARPSAAIYHPGAEAEVRLQVKNPNAEGVLGALGMVVTDKAVDERHHTDEEFGKRTYGFYGARSDLFGPDDRIGGISLRDLQKLNSSSQLSTDLDMVAEVLLNQNSSYMPTFFGADNYDTDSSSTFSDLIKKHTAQISAALRDDYERSGEYPTNENELRLILTGAGIDLDKLRDPWRGPYKPFFSIDKGSQVLSFKSAGPDKLFENDDDASVETNRWPYFRPIGQVIDRANHRYHSRTHNFIRDYATLTRETRAEGIDLDKLKDQWGQPYKFEFGVDTIQLVIRVLSGGPDREFSANHEYSSDDFTIWTSQLNYFSEMENEIESRLLKYLHDTKEYPQNDKALAEALKTCDCTLATLRDPWGHAYYSTFSTQSIYVNRVHVENVGRAGEQANFHTDITPVIQQARVIHIRSAAADGKRNTSDDFDVAAFTNIVSEQSAAESKPRLSNSSLVLSGGTGAIAGHITDQTGAVVPGATVSTTLNSQTVFSTSGADGKYVLLNLAPGIYEVRVEASGFMFSRVANVVVAASNVTTVDIHLIPGATTETVTVTASSPSTQTQASVSVAEIKELPISGRTFSSLVKLRPGITAVTRSGGPTQISTPRMREYFPETLVWQPSLETDAHGRAKINFKLADNITTWKMSVIGSTEDGQIGTAETEIKSFQPFFVEHEPPKTLTQGDEISLPVVVRNYLERPQNVDLEMKPENWFELMGEPHKRLAVPAGDAARGTFEFRAVAAVKAGKQRVTAIASDDSDAIEKSIAVHPDGEEVSVTAGDILGDSAALDLNVLPTAIAGSQHGELKIYPNLMAHVAESIEAVMERPYGCGEQTISSSYPSLLLLKYEKQASINAPSPAHNRARRYLQSGYERLLTYRHESGGFTYWGRGEPDIALTAYALRFLTDAAEVINVDADVIEETQLWLVKQQHNDGSWPARFYWSSTEDLRRTPLVTGYVLRQLAGRPSQEKEDSAKSGNISLAIGHALDYLEQRLTEVDEPYLLASYILAAIEAHESARATQPLAKLRSLAHKEGHTSYWVLETNTPFYGWGLAGRVETTALVLQALSRAAKANIQIQNPTLTSSPATNRPTIAPTPVNTGPANQTTDTQSDEPIDSISFDPLIRSGLLFLLKQKDRYGVWYSTQATTNVLGAMVALIDGSHLSNTRTTTAKILVNGRDGVTINLPAANDIASPMTVDISPMLRSGANRIEIQRPPGAAVASAQVVANYYVPWSESSAGEIKKTHPGESTGLRLLTQFNRTSGRIGDDVVCHVEAERIGFSGYGMLLAEIGLPPGADVDRQSLESAVKASGWTINQYDVLPDRVVVYLWPRAGGVNFDFKFRPRFGMKAQSAPSSVYDYYNPEARAVVKPKQFIVK